MTVLHVEDDRILTDLVRRVLEGRPGIKRVDSASTLAEAQRKLASHAYDVLLVDLCLADSQGTATVAALRPYRVPIVILSGATCGLDTDAERRYIAELARAGADDYVSKVALELPDFVGRISFACARSSRGIEPPKLRGAPIVSGLSPDLRDCLRCSFTANPHGLLVGA